MEDEQRAAAQEGVRAWVRRGAWPATRTALLASLSASALAPLAVTEPGAAVVAAVFGIVGSVGANLLSGIIGAALTAPPERLEAELARLLEKALEKDAALADTLTDLLDRADVTRVVMEETLDSGFLGSVDTRLENILFSVRRQFNENREQTVLLTEILDRLPSCRGLPGASTWEGECPYQGLAPFGAAQAGVFYGRTEATARLRELVTAHRDGGLIVVTGSSGAGKSSVLHAGLLPGLTRSGEWVAVTFTPGPDPVRELTAQLALRVGADPDAPLTDPAARARQVVAADRVGNDRARHLIVVVDQFEELFTLSGAGEAFVPLLEALAGQAVVVVSVRGDYVDRCADHPALAGALQARAFVLGPMNEQELQRTITGPAAAAGLGFETGLPQLIVSELATGAGALPLLSMAMVRTWDNREGGRLTRTGYDRSGGVTSAVRHAAEETYRSLPRDLREQARQTITAMTVTGAEGRVSRRRVPLGELAGPVVEVFTRARLMVTDEQTAELAHDILLTAWPRLGTWLAAGRADRIVHGELVQDAAEWSVRHHDPSFLYRGVRLEEVTQAVTRWRSDPARYPGLEPPPAATAFLHAGSRAATQARRRNRTVTTVLAVLTVIALITAVTAVRFGQDARTAGAQAVSRQVALDTPSRYDAPMTAARLAAAS